METANMTTGEQLSIAKELGVCRVCGQPIGLPMDPEYPQQWDRCYGRVIPTGPGQSVTVNYGEEFAHTNCLIVSKHCELVAQINNDAGQSNGA